MRFLLLGILGIIKGIMLLFLIMIFIALALAGGWLYIGVFLGIYFLITIIFNGAVKSIKNKRELRVMMKQEEEELKAEIRRDIFSYGPNGSRRKAQRDTSKY